jgi:hypothetical protein
MERMLKSRIKIYYRPAGHEDMLGIGDPLMSLDYETLYLVWKFGGYENDCPWHKGIHLGGASHLTMSIE